MKLSNISDNLKQVANQKVHAREILAKVSKHFEFALIAGGAPRNWAYNRPANDFDIYVCRKKDYNNQDKIDKDIAKSVKALGDEFGFGENRAACVVNSNAYGGFILHSLYDFKHEQEENQDCQFIIIDDNAGFVKDLKSFALQIFSTYDFGICMTSMDKDGAFHNHPMFDEDFKNKTFTVDIQQLRRNNSSGMRKLVERFEKMEKYFPDHKMRICA